MEPASAEKAPRVSLKGVQWKWVFAAFFFYVFFCYFPTVVIFVITRSLYALFIYLLGFSVSGFLVGYMSKGYTIREPAIGAVLFVGMFLFTILASGVTEAKIVGWVIWMLLGFFLGLTGAWAGEKMQMRVERKYQQRTAAEQQKSEP